MPDRESVVHALNASERRNRAWAEFRLNLCLARLIGDPLTTRYDWKLISLYSADPASWRTFRRGQLGYPWPISIWALTTINVGNRKVVMGGVLLAMSLGQLFANSMLWTVWADNEIDDQADSYEDLTQVLVRLYSEGVIKTIADREEFRRHVASLD